MRIKGIHYKVKAEGKRNLFFIRVTRGIWVGSKLLWNPFLRFF